jgi:flagellar biosynthesis/type III secretory pathway chaperone
MNRRDIALDMILDELLSVLDAELGLLDVRRDQLSRLGSIVLDRRMDEAPPLLEDIEQTVRDQQRVDIRLAASRATIANHLGVDAEHLRLSQIVDLVDSRRAVEIDYRRQQIIHQTRAIQKENMRVSMMISEIGKLNRLMLEAIFPQQTRVTTYGSAGSQTWQTSQSLVNAER